MTPLEDRIEYVDQHTPEWLAVRRGCVTASRVKALRARKRGDGELKERRHLRFQLLAEILKDETTEHYVSPAMDWGIQEEPRAKAEYEMRTGYSLEPIGFLSHPTLPRAGCSPDGWVRPDGFAEFKCPNTDTHLEYLDAGVVPADYLPQLYWQMACAGPEIKWIDFVSYDRRIDKKFQLFICRLERDAAVEKAIADMEKEVEAFLAELNGMAQRLMDNAKFISREDKLRESLRRASKYPTDDELRAELASIDGPLVP